jgi:quinol monooxygenase YgiN
MPARDLPGHRPAARDATPRAQSRDDLRNGCCDGSAPVLIALGDVYAQIERREEVRELMRATQARAREAEGCEYYTFAETLDDPGHFVLAQRWRDRAALEEHYGSQAFADYQAQIGPLLVRTSELRLFDAQTSARLVNRDPIEISQED